MRTRLMPSWSTNDNNELDQGALSTIRLTTTTTDHYYYSGHIIDYDSMIMYVHMFTGGRGS